MFVLGFLLHSLSVSHGKQTTEAKIDKSYLLVLVIFTFSASLMGSTVSLILSVTGQGGVCGLLTIIEDHKFAYQSAEVKCRPARQTSRWRELSGRIPVDVNVESDDEDEAGLSGTDTQKANAEKDWPELSPPWRQNFD